MTKSQLSEIKLREADRIEITILIDNYTNIILTGTEKVKRPVTMYGEKDAPKPPIAEHGLSQLIRIEGDGERHTILMDAGVTDFGTAYNVRALKIDLGETEAIVISHGHTDHIAGLEELVALIPTRPIPLVLHPHAVVNTRYRILGDGRKKMMVPLDEKSLSEKGVSFVKSESPSLMASGFLATTGQVDRLTEFETGSPDVYFEEDGVQKRDLIIDDQACILLLKDKGLVIVSGCAHSGIINTIIHAQKLTGVDKVHAVIGGFHLSGEFFEGRIEQTIDELEKFEPLLVVPNHCTGWKAMSRFAERMPKAFALSTVGTTFILD
jgi:7,8-dihydropterin-6-yl-methyl-4-(beta-D-ribofuranosyl)aminobenzene 5'-phosphate synthase